MSEVAKLREEIEREAENLRLLATGFKTVASHQIIEATYENLGKKQDRLGQLIGEGAAVRIVVSALGFPDEYLSLPPSIIIEPFPHEQKEVVRKILEVHDCKLDSNEIFLPERAVCAPVYPRGDEQRYSILLPDGFQMWLKVTHEGRNVLSINPSDLVCPTCKHRLV